MVHVIDNVLLPEKLPGSVQLASGAGGAPGAAAGVATLKDPRPATPGVVDAASLQTDTVGMDSAVMEVASEEGGAAATAPADFATVLDAATSSTLNLTKLAGAVNVSLCWPAAGLLPGCQLAGRLGWLCGWHAQRHACMHLSRWHPLTARLSCFPIDHTQAAGLSALFGNDFKGTLFAPVDEVRCPPACLPARPPAGRCVCAAARAAACCAARQRADRCVSHLRVLPPAPVPRASHLSPPR